MSSFAENLQFAEREKGPDTMRTNLATVLDPSRRSNDARDFETALHRKIVGQDQAIEKVAEIYQMFPVLKSMKGRRGGDLSGGQQQQLAIGRALAMKPKVLILDEPTEGIQPSIIKDIGRAITHLRQLGRIAIVLVEQYLDFAHELGDRFAVMDRGAVVYACERADVDEQALRRAMAL